MLLLPDAAAATEIPVKPEDDLSQFDNFKQRFDLMAQRWGAIESRAIDARQVRQARVNVANLKASGILSANETYIANRLIDENITRALPSRLQYLKSGGRLALFEPQDARLKVAIAEIQQLESEFWRVMTYDNWEMDYIKAFDGSELLGWDWVEVAYDESRPGHVNVSHVGNDYLIFDQTIQSLQESSIVGRQYLLSEVRLRALAKANSFNETVVAEVMEKLKVDTSQNGVLITHFFFKTADGLVSHGWYYKTSSAFLKDPAPYYNGVDIQVTKTSMPTDGSLDQVTTTTWEHVHETAYPFIPLLHRNTEEKLITRVPGRIDDDYYIQEATSGLMSALVNGAKNASITMWAPKDTNAERGTSAPKQTEVILKNGAIWDVPLIPMNVNFPDAGLFKAIGLLSTRNAEANAQISAATNNRQDSRKTATEVASANHTNDELKSTDVLFWSMFLRNVFQASWRIVQSQALQGLITFMPDPKGDTNVALVKESFTLKPAGDTDYVLRAAKIGAMQEDMPMIVKTPLAETFATDYLRLRYPDRADAYVEVLKSAKMQKEQAMKAALVSVSKLLKEAVTDETGKLNPEWQAHSAQLEQVGQQVAQLLNEPAPEPGAA